MPLRKGSGGAKSVRRVGVAGPAAMGGAATRVLLARLRCLAGPTLHGPMAPLARKSVNVRNVRNEKNVNYARLVPLLLSWATFLLRLDPNEHSGVRLCVYFPGP